MTASRLASEKLEARSLRQAGPWVLRSRVGAYDASMTNRGVCRSTSQAMSEAHDIELLFDMWEQNVETVRALNRSSEARRVIKSGLVTRKHLSLRHRSCQGSQLMQAHRWPMSPLRNSARPRIDKSALTISEPKRIRCKEHLRFVASQPCLICGRSPAHAHHVRYAQSRGLSLKVSDEFTVPLCATHHHHIHTTGKEREWWQERNIDPLKVASALWQQSRERHPLIREAGLPGVLENDQRQSHAQGNDSATAGTPHPSDSANREP